MAPSAPSALRTALVSLPPVALALWSVAHMQGAIGPFFNPLVERCAAETAHIGNPILRFYECFNCVFVPFFKETLERDEGLFIWGSYGGLNIAFTAFQAVESSRLGTRFPLHWHTLFALGFACFGVSVGLPLLWLPAYFALGMPASFRGGAKGLKISWPRICTIWVFNVLVFVGGAAPMPEWELDPHFRDIGIKLMCWVPILTPLLLPLVPVSETCDASKGQLATKLMHFCNAGMALACHVAMALFLASKPLAAWKLTQLPVSHEGGVGCVYFLLVDLAIFWVSLVYHVWVEDGILVALVVVLSTPLLGLGAPLSLYYVYRESRIFDRRTPGDTTKTKSE